jgi:hypothetical protein
MFSLFSLVSAVAAEPKWDIRIGASHSSIQHQSILKDDNHMKSSKDDNHMKSRAVRFRRRATCRPLIGDRCGEP